MTEWASRPRQTPWTGRRKGTHTWCARCERLHKTHRAVGGPERCPLDDRPAAGTVPIPSLITRVREVRVTQPVPGLTIRGPA